MNKRIIKHKKLNEAFEEFSYRQRISDDDEIKSVKDLNQMMSKLRSEAHRYGVDIDDIDSQTGFNGDFTYVFSLIGSKENMEKFLRGSKNYQDFLGINPDDPQDIEDELHEMNKRARKLAVEESLTDTAYYKKIRDELEWNQDLSKLREVEDKKDRDRLLRQITDAVAKRVVRLYPYCNNPKYRDYAYQTGKKFLKNILGEGMKINESGEPRKWWTMFRNIVLFAYREGSLKYNEIKKWLKAYDNSSIDADIVDVEEIIDYYEDNKKKVDEELDNLEPAIKNYIHDSVARVNKKKMQNTYESVNKGKKLTEAPARIKVPEPFNKYYYWVNDTFEGDYQHGDEFENYPGIHFLGYLMVKDKYEDILYDAVLTDDPNWPVCELIGGSLIPVEIPKYLKESAIEQPERMRTANVGDTIIYKGDKIKLKRKDFIYSEVDRKKIPVFIGEVNGKERKYFPADIDYMLKMPGTLKEAFDTSSQYEYDDLVADMFGNMSDAELDKQLRDLKRYAKHLGLKKPDDMVIIRLEGDDEYIYDPANYYRGTHLNDNVVLYDDFDTELVSLVRELINGNVWLYFANSGDAETYTTEIDRINLVDETEADSVDDFDLEDEGE